MLDVVEYLYEHLLFCQAKGDVVRVLMGTVMNDAIHIQLDMGSARSVGPLRAVRGGLVHKDSRIRGCGSRQSAERWQGSVLRAIGRTWEHWERECQPSS